MNIYEVELNPGPSRAEDKWVVSRNGVVAHVFHTRLAAREGAWMLARKDVEAGIPAELWVELEGQRIRAHI